MLSRLTSTAAVERALAEFDRKGRDQFIADSNFGYSRGYFIRRAPRLYDAKAIAGRALEIQHADLRDLPHDAFRGGVPVKRKLEALGYSVVRTGAGQTFRG